MALRLNIHIKATTANMMRKGTLLCILSLLFLSLPAPSMSERCNANDKKVLLQIKQSLNNPYYLASWKPDTDCCDWYVVKCDSKNNRIISLAIFDDANFTGQIPAAVGDLPYLQMLDLNRLPKLTGPIPSSIGKLSKLTFLRLSHNSLTGSIPSSLTKLKNLNFLDVSYNQLCGKIPVGGKLQSIDVAYYSNNKCLCGAPLAACK